MRGDIMSPRYVKLSGIAARVCVSIIFTDAMIATFKYLFGGEQ